MSHPVVLITGASGGLGRALLRAFGNGEWKIAAGTRTPSTASAMDSVCWFRIDVTQKAEIEKAVEEIILRWGRIDCLINNAGVTDDSLSWKITDEIYERVAAVNLKGSF